MLQLIDTFFFIDPKIKKENIIRKKIKSKIKKKIASDTFFFLNPAEDVQLSERLVHK